MTIGFTCPFCGRVGGCDHYLLSVNLSLQEALAGPLAVPFYKRWSAEWAKIAQDEADGTGGAEGSHVFDFCLNEVAAFSAASADEHVELALGERSTIRHFFCEDSMSVDAALRVYGRLA